LRREGKEEARRPGAGFDGGRGAAQPESGHPSFVGEEDMEGREVGLPALIGLGWGKSSFETHLCTCLQWTSILERRSFRGVNRAAPYERIGNTSEWASR